MNIANAGSEACIVAPPVIAAMDRDAGWPGIFNYGPVRVRSSIGSLQRRSFRLRGRVRRAIRSWIASQFLTPVQWALLSPVKRWRNRSKSTRNLEIGPGAQRTDGFETVNIVGGFEVDYVCDASRRLPFPDETFDVVYASHVLEHIPWFQTERTVREWARVLKRGGRLEIWVPDGELICETVLMHSRGTPNDAHLDGWRMMNPGSDPYLWANGRLFYGVNDDYPSWHKAIFTEASLSRLFARIGLKDVRRPSEQEYRGGHNHGPINLGIFGTKP
jgi:SAM-dependent methyltransferase